MKILTLNIQVITGDPRPIFKQIVEGIRMDIHLGTLPIGGKLPSVRSLAKQLTINPNTVSKAYGELTAQGLLDAQQGRGLFVAQPRQLLSDDEQIKRLDDATDRFVNDVVNLDFTNKQLIEQLQARLDSLKMHRKDDGE